MNYYIINPQSGKALAFDVARGNANGTNIHLWERNQSDAQKWVVNTDGSIINPGSGKALDVSGGGTRNGTNIHLWEKNGTGAQKWTINADGTIINPQSGKALDVSEGGSANGTNIHLWWCNGTGAQKWVLKPVDNMLVYKLQSRPTRSGMWFLCHRDHVHQFPYEEAVDIYEEFFRWHPNGSEAARGFLAVKLDQAAIDKLASEICMSSYRWDGTQPVEDGTPEVSMVSYSCPSNYLWFLEHIHQEKRLGWVDFVANAGVNCPTDSVVGYMGSLYATLPTVGFWMTNLDGLAEANTRAWIFQEMSFGPLETVSVRKCLQTVRSNFIEVKRRRSQHALLELLSVVEYLGTLLTRRGFLCWSEKSADLTQFTWNRYGGPQYCITIAELLVRQMQMPPTATALLRDEIPVRISSLAAVACLDIFSSEDATFIQQEEALIRMLTTPSYLIADDETDFGRIFYPAMAQAYCETMLTWEPDRENAIFSVACAILADRFEIHMHPKQMLLEAWKSRLACDVTVVLSSASSCTWTTSVFSSVNSKSTKERSALGFGMEMKGTKVLDDCEIKVSDSGSMMTRIQLESDIRKECSYLGNSEYRGAGNNRKAELFACLPCRELQDVCKERGAGCLFYLLVDRTGSTIIKLMYKVYQLQAFEMMLHPAPDMVF